jgi:transposase
VPSMPQPAQPDQHTSTTDEIVLGVDTHKDLHVAAVLTALGAVAASRRFPTTMAGYHQLLAWARTFGTLRRAGVECTGSYGAALTRHLQAAGITVIEVNQPDKATHRRGKTDTIDAQAAAQAVLAGRATAVAKSGDGPVEMLPMFKLAKNSAIKSRTQAINQLKAILVAADPTLREALSGLSTPILIRQCAQLPHGRAQRRHQRRDLDAGAAGLPDPGADRRDRRPQPAARPRRQPAHPQAAAAARGGARLRRGPAHHRRGPPPAAGQRSLLRRAVRRQPGPGVLRQDRPPAPEPRRRPASQRRAGSHRAVASALGSTDPCLPCPTHRRRQDPP